MTQQAERIEPDELDILLGIDPNDPQQQLARRLVQADHVLIDELIQARKSAGLTRAQLAERMGRDVATVADIETLSADPCLSTLRRYALAVGVVIEHQVREA